jgi:hypothetical protein
MKQKIVATFFNTREKILTDNNPSETPWNFYNIDERGINIRIKPDCVIIDKDSENIHVLKSGEKIENIM